MGSKLIPYSEITTENNQYPPLTSSRKGLFLQTDYFNRQVASEDNTGYNIVPYGYFTYRHMSDDRTFYFNINEIVEKGIVSTLYPVFTTTDGLNSHFLRAYLNYSKRFALYCVLQKQGGSRTYMYFRKLCAHNAVIPSVEEQEKIADFIDLLDKRIKLQNEKIECLKKYKRGAFDAVFTQKIRLIPEHEQREWTVFNLSDFATRITRKNGNKTDIPLTISAQYGLIDQRKYFSKTVASSDMSGYFLLHQGEFAYNRSTSNDYPLGSIKRLEQHECGAVSTLYLCFAIKESVVLPELAKWYFETSLWHKGVREICAEGARSHGLLNVPTEGFFTTTHKLPFDLEEQRKIANYLGLIHRKCEEAEDVLMSLIRLRNGLVQRLFI